MATIKTTGAKFEVEKFNGRQNFSLWQRRMKNVLIKEGLSKALLGVSKKPADMTDEAWMELDEKARCTIELCLADEVMFKIMDETSAAGLWLKLESLYMTKSLTNKLLLKKQLYGLQMKEGTSLQQHVTTFNKLLNDLKCLEIKLEEEDQAVLLLNSLPKSYENFVMTLLLNRETLEMEEVMSALDTNESMFKQPTNSDALGLVAEKETKKNKGGKDSASTSKSGQDSACHFCNKEGHFKRNCAKYKRWLAKHKESNTSNQESQAGVAEESEEPECEVLSAHPNKVGSEDWLLDSGCSYHMCPNKELFSTYKEYNGSKVLMGNDAVCNTVRLGNIRLQMFDGTVADVRHVPELRKKLTSLGALEVCGCKISLAEGKLQVHKDAQVIMKGERRGNLYMLVGSAVTGDAAVGVEDQNKADITKLWHMRLGHMSEKGLEVLHARKLLRG